MRTLTEVPTSALLSLETYIRAWRLLSGSVSAYSWAGLAEAHSLLVFAPVAVLMQYEEIEDAIELANNTKYGLGASVFGYDQEQCIEVAKRLECGMVSINDFGVFYVSFF